MHSMTQNDALVVGGVDAHADAHHVAGARSTRSAALDQELPHDNTGLAPVARLAEQSQVFNSLRADLADTAQPQPAVSTTIMCGNPGFGINRIRT